MEKTPSGTSVGVDDPYEHGGVCDHLTDDGTCRFAYERPEADPSFATARRTDDFACHVVADASDEDLAWCECPHYRSRSSERICARCGLEERRSAHDDERPLLEEHHLSYPDGSTGHEITVYLCRWCHANVHNSWGRITDEASPDAAALAAQEARRSRELDELEFRSAADRYGD